MSAAEILADAEHAAGMTPLSGWGNYPQRPTQLLTPRTTGAVRDLVVARSGVVARGAGRAYGDAAVGTQSTLSLRGLNRMRGFEATSARLTVEAGVTIAEILTAFVPRGWFLRAVPGTKFVTIGGAIAADVHGKNHHRDGGFGNFVESFRLVLPSGEIVTCSRQENPQLFAATIGGMGLTGVIVEATIQLLPIETGWMRQETRVADNLDSAMDLLERTASTTYSVAWIDCLASGASLGRALIYLAEHAAERDARELPARSRKFPAARSSRTSVPDIIPSGVLNRHLMRAFNECYYRRGAAGQGKSRLVDWDSYFFPLDSIANWNRIYGGRGFAQYQCVVPHHAARSALAEILGRASRRGDASFLAVLKKLGEGSGVLSFPLRGYTLTMDFPVDRSLVAFLHELDRVVVDAGGRLYLAKDACQTRATFEAGYPGLGSFKSIRRQIGADRRFVSHLSSRLEI
jgi:FAD/FMN-containing dehydrogenase